MKLLEDRIIRDGKVLPGNVLKIDSFLNHQLDPMLMHEMAIEYKNYFSKYEINKILTIEASGIAIAIMTAYEMKVPCVYAKKTLSSNIGDSFYVTTTHSYTHNNDNKIIISKCYLNENDHILIIDDFLALGNAAHGLIKLCEKANAKICGIGVAVEKGFQDGGKSLREEGYDLYSLAIIDSMDENSIKFR